MGAITIRNLSEPVHDWLRGKADERQTSVEALCRLLLADAMVRDTPNLQNGPGMSEAPMAFVPPAKVTAKQKMTGLWGALKGSVHVPDTTDLTAPLFERWKAEG